MLLRCRFVRATANGSGKAQADPETAHSTHTLPPVVPPVVPAKAETHFAFALLFCSNNSNDNSNDKMGSGFRRDDGASLTVVSAKAGISAPFPSVA